MILFHGSEMISYHFTVELSNQIDYNKLVGPIGLHVIFLLTPAENMAGSIALQFHHRNGASRFVNVSFSVPRREQNSLIFFKHVICNKPTNM